MTDVLTKEETRAIMVAESSPLAGYLDTAEFEQGQRGAKLIAASSIIPDHYRNNIPNTFIALQWAKRLKKDPVMVMQHTYVVHGKLGFDAQFAIAEINTSGMFKDSLDYEIQGDDCDNPMDPSFRCRAFATKKSTDQVIRGPWITWDLVKAEGWDKPKGEKGGASKWMTMPELMFRYRAATYFARLYCPERLMGMQTTEELIDIGPQQNATVASAAGNNRLASVMAAAEASETREPIVAAAVTATTVSGNGHKTSVPAANAASTGGASSAPVADTPTSPAASPAGDTPAAATTSAEAASADPTPPAAVRTGRGGRPTHKPAAPQPAAPPVEMDGGQMADAAENFASGLGSVAQAQAWLVDRHVGQPKIVGPVFTAKGIPDPRKVEDLDALRSLAYEVKLTLLMNGVSK
jgi:hypothetical protein